MAVDSTWHHFFSINLIGDPIAPGDQQKGFTGTAAGQQALSDIESYYRNLAVWLARASTQQRLFPAAASRLRPMQPLNEMVRNHRRHAGAEVLRISAIARGLLPRSAPEWAGTLSLYAYLEATSAHALLAPHAWSQRPKMDETQAASDDLVLEAAPGGAITGLAQHPPRDGEWAHEALDEVVWEGVRHGLRLHFERQQRDSRAMVEAATQALDGLGAALAG